MIFLFYFLIFFVGVSLGSFLNVLIHRLPQEKAIGGRSDCPQCGHQLGWRDLAPVLSFIFLRGRCRYCGKPISWQYPIVELATGILFLLVISHQRSVISENTFFDLAGLVYLLFIVLCLIVIFVSDLKYFIIPDQIVLVGIAATLFYKFFWIFISNGVEGWELKIFKSLGVSLLSALGAAAFFLSIVFITRGRGMGLGDVKFAFLMGLVLGWPKILLALFLAFSAGALFGLTLVAARLAKMNSPLPFGVFLSAATFLAMVWGEKIIVLGQEWSSLLMV